MLLRLAFKELWNNKKFVLFFVANLSLGLACFIGLDSFKNSIQDTLYKQSREILAADLRVGGRRGLTIDERKAFLQALPAGSKVSSVTELYSMLSFKNVSRLVQVKVIEDSYPYYGELTLADGSSVTEYSPKDISIENGVWVQPELLIQLGAKLGDTISLGDSKFKILNSVIKDSSSAWSGIALAPRIYVSAKFISGTNLVKFGTTAFYSNLIKLPPKADEFELEKKLNVLLPDPGIDIKTHRNASEQVGTLLNYLNDYLGLVSLVALFLCGLGVSFFYRSYIAKRYRDTAVLKSLGFSDSKILILYLIQIVILGLLSTIPAVLGSKALLPFLGSMTQDLLNIEIHVRLMPSTMGLAAITSVILSVLIGWPLLHPLKEIRPNILLQEHDHLDTRWKKRNLLLYLPATIIFWFTAMWISQSYIIGSSFLLAFLASLVLLSLAGYMIVIFIARLEIRNIQLKIVIRNLARHKFATLSCFVSISLAVLLINLIPQIQAGIQAQLHGGSSTPSLFLFDIQEDQVKDINSVLESKGTALLQLSPMVRARLTNINGQPFHKSNDPKIFESREQNQERRSRNRSYNLSYREKLASSEKVKKGKYFSDRFYGNGIPEISVEDKFADRMGIKIGDLLEFDVQGLDIAGKITSIREINWTSFEPNFFIQFQPGVLEEAPKTYLASIPPLETEKKVILQNELVKKLPNISIIDVTAMVERISDMVRQMSLALTFMAYFSMLVGFVILYSVASHQAFERRREMLLLKILGTSVQKISILFTSEFLFISICASFFGVLFSYILSFIFSKSFFGNQWIFSLKLPLLVFFSLQLIAFLIVRLSANQILKSKYSNVSN